VGENLGVSVKTGVDLTCTPVPQVQYIVEKGFDMSCQPNLGIANNLYNVQFCRDFIGVMRQ
jgi:hypothetical protein